MTHRCASCTVPAPQFICVTSCFLWRLQTLGALRDRDGPTCCYCGEDVPFMRNPPEGKKASIEHVLDRRLGGTDDLENLKLCHNHCNGLAVRWNYWMKITVMRFYNHTTAAKPRWAA